MDMYVAMHMIVHTYIAMYICMAVTKTRTGLGLDWRWTRTFMCFLWFCALLPTFIIALWNGKCFVT